MKIELWMVACFRQGFVHKGIVGMRLLHSKELPISFLVEEEAYEGVKRIATTVAKDFEKISGVAPVIVTDIKDVNNAKGSVILFATYGHSPLVDKLKTSGKINTKNIKGKNEVFHTTFVDSDIYKDILAIVGSDKRGTIYGMFSLSEYIGISPLHFWGDVKPNKKDKIEINEDIQITSKEPSVKYRGFTINNEWPCFGNWTFSRFGGFNVNMYEHVFELLLRLKGNYIWPAMWTSSFALDGPGNQNEELAHTYGVVVGASHHEPCLRASEEWDIVRGPESKYGNEWNYYTNKDGLLKFWEDGLKRSGHLEKIIMIGMRGERDSSILGDDASIKENVDLLKDVIVNQRRLIEEHVSYDSPMMIALYKEVEEFFYGNEETEGLKDWDGLDDVICMLCEDNFGFVRSLPSKELGDRRYGMYYHFDYHGVPISYEWMPSTTFERTKDQMSMAYEYGIKDVWVLNVGDLKFNEVPLGYFMALAYDFDKHGTSNPLAVEFYTREWLEHTFPLERTQIQERIGKVLHSYIHLNSIRRPEALNANTYHPCHYLESDRILDFANEIETDNEYVYSNLTYNAKDAYYSMIYIPAKASVNLLKMHVYSTKNIHYAKQGKKVANKYADLVAKCIEEDRAIMEDFAAFNGGKWKGMELGEHIGFTSWNEDNCRNPLRMIVEPFHKPRLIVSRKDEGALYYKAYGPPMTVVVDDFLYEGNEEVILEVANDGAGTLDFCVEWKQEAPWLELGVTSGITPGQELLMLNPREKFVIGVQNELVLRCDRSKLTTKESKAQFLIKGSDGTIVAVDVQGKTTDLRDLPPMTFLENRGVIAIEANHFAKKKDTKKGGFEELINYGRSGSGMKIFPLTACFAHEIEKPSLTYNVFIEKSGEYEVEVWTTPTNPVERHKPLRFVLNNEELTAVPADYNAGSLWDPLWSKGVLDNIRKTSCTLEFAQGVQEVTIQPLEAGLIIERILIYKKGHELPESYLGPEESFYIQKYNF